MANKDFLINIKKREGKSFLRLHLNEYNKYIINYLKLAKLNKTNLIFHSKNKIFLLYRNRGTN